VEWKWKWEKGAEDEGSNYFEEKARKGESWKQSEQASSRADEQTSGSGIFRGSGILTEARKKGMYSVERHTGLWVEMQRARLLKLNTFVSGQPDLAGEIAHSCLCSRR
jgi:hypothetical protein